MKIDRDIEKVLDKSDAIITNAGYKQLEQQEESPDTGDFVDASITDDGQVEFDVSPFDGETGLPIGLREAPMG